MILQQRCLYTLYMYLRVLNVTFVLEWPCGIDKIISVLFVHESLLCGDNR